MDRQECFRTFVHDRPTLSHSHNIGRQQLFLVPFLRVPIDFAQFSKKKFRKKKNTHHPRQVNAFLLSTLSLKGSLLSNGDADVVLNYPMVLWPELARTNPGRLHQPGRGKILTLSHG